MTIYLTLMRFYMLRWPLSSKPFKIMALFAALLLGLVAIGLPNVYAEEQQLQLSYQDDLVSIVAQNVSIGKVLTELAEKTGIYVNFPADMDNTVTLRQSGVSLNSALKTLLKGWNHVIIYAKPAKGKATIAQVLVYSEKHPSPSPASPASSSNLARIQSYERQIDSLRQRLSTVDQDSGRAKSYQNRIESLENRIQSLQEN